jgi:glucose/arabinose dehydrogenase
MGRSRGRSRSRRDRCPPRPPTRSFSAASVDEVKRDRRFGRRGGHGLLLTGSHLSADARFATGMRHTLALAVHPATGRLYGAISGRDQLLQLWGFPAERNAELPAEELVRIEEGDDYGWPYCYHDGVAGRKVLAPEYGGDGEKVGRCAGKDLPRIAFPAHWAPMEIVFYTARQFPPEYRGGAFVAFHGSWNRAPLPQEGYRVVHAAFEDGEPTGSWRVLYEPGESGEPEPAEPPGDSAGSGHPEAPE